MSTDRISSAHLDALSETMLITLWAKVLEQAHSIPLLIDTEAPHIVERLDYDFGRLKGMSRMSLAGCCGRASIFDDDVRVFLGAHPDAVVMNVGAGLDARYERLGRPALTAWFDMDLPEVMALRRQLLPPSGVQQYLDDSLLEDGWIETLVRFDKPILLVFEGVLMYFEEAEVQSLMARLQQRLPGVHIIFDLLPLMFQKRSRRHDALRHLGTQPPEFKWAMGNPQDMETWQKGLKVLKVQQLHERCASRYPWFARLLYLTRWAQDNMDQRVVQISLDAG